MSYYDPFDEEDKASDKRGLLWAVIVSIIMWTVFGLAILWATEARGGEVKLVWNANPASEQVSEYKIWRVEGTVRTKIGSVTTNAATIPAEPGWIVTVTAYNGLDSEPATPITIPTPIPRPDATHLTIQRSTDLKTWTDIAQFYDPKLPTVFYRIKVEPQP